MGYLETEDYSKWLTEDGLHSTTVGRPWLSSRELLHWCNRARLEFYTNPRFLAKMVKQAALDPREAVRIAKGSKVLFKHMIRYTFTDEAKVEAKKGHHARPIPVVNS